LNLPNCRDIEIWTSFKKGEASALSFIFSDNAEKLFHYGLKFTLDRDLIEDLIQDLFCELMEHRRTLGNTDNILFYLLKSFRRKLMRKLKTEQRTEHTINFEEQAFNVEWSIEHELISNEISRLKNNCLIKALKKLSSRQKEAVYLRFSRELDYKEIANIMDISVEACRNLISNAIKRLKQSISANEKNSVIGFLFVNEKIPH